MMGYHGSVVASQRGAIFMTAPPILVTSECVRIAFSVKAATLWHFALCSGTLW